MTEGTLTLRELFEVNPNELSARVESGLDAPHAANSAREAIAKEASSIRWPWLRTSVAEKSRELLDLNVVDFLVGTWKKYMEI